MNNLNTELFEIHEQLSKPVERLADPKVFDKIVKHIVSNKTIKIKELNKQSVNINDLVKFAQLVLFAEIQQLNQCDFYVDPAPLEALSLQDQFKFWEVCNSENEYAYLDDLFTIAFSKFRGGGKNIKQSTPHLSRELLEWVETPYMAKLRDAWAQQNFMKDQLIFENAYYMTSWFKFDNKDRQNLISDNESSKFKKRFLSPFSIDTTFDFDERHGNLCNVLDRDPKKRISAFAYLCMLKHIKYKNNVTNTLIKLGIFHLSEIALIDRIEETRTLIQ